MGQQYKCAATVVILNIAHYRLKISTDSSGQQPPRARQAGRAAFRAFRASCGRRRRFESGRVWERREPNEFLGREIVGETRTDRRGSFEKPPKASRDPWAASPSAAAPRIGSPAITKRSLREGGRSALCRPSRASRPLIGRGICRGRPRLRIWPRWKGFSGGERFIDQRRSPDGFREKPASTRKRRPGGLAPRRPLARSRAAA